MDVNPSYDVIVIGGGNAGLCSAISAGQAGASVLVLEVAPWTMRGGNSRHTRNMRCAHDAATEVLTGPYTEDEFWEDLLRVTEGATDEALARLMIRESKYILGWLADLGVRFQPALSGTLSLGRTNAFFLGGGKAMLNSLYRAADELGVEFVYRTQVQRLHIEDGRFASLSAELDDQRFEVEGNALIAAAGGFQANIDWLREHWGAAADNFLIRGTPYNRGMLLRQLLDHGVQAVGDATQCHAVAIDARAPRFDGGIVTRLDCVPFSIVVNRHAQRFYDEGEDIWPKRYAIWGRLVASQPDQIAYSIFDAKARELFMPSMNPPIEARSIRALAEELQLPADALSETVESYNMAVVDGDFDPSALDQCQTSGLLPAKSHWAQRVDTPPFFAYPLRPGITFTYLGTKIRDDGKVVMTNGSAAANVYAAGEIMAGNILGRGYPAGTGMTIGSVFGRIAGREAASLG